MKRCIASSHLCGIILVSILAVLLGCGRYNFFSDGKPLIAEMLGGAATKLDEIHIHELFNHKPGQIVSLQSYGGAVDPVGTTITNDFDGDGITNDKETTTNVWVADYPQIESSVTPPITMSIEVLETNTSTTETMTSEIDASDVEDNIDKSSESVHRNEVNMKTVQFQDSFDSASSLEMSQEQSSSVTASVSFMVGSANFAYSQGSSVSRAMNNSYGETKTKWKDVPFKNHLGRSETSVKRDVASKNSNNLRNEMRTTTERKYEIKPDGGYVRAALYMSNESVNMPVKMKNILCSFMFETPDGQLIPVQSFRLRNDDYTIFQVELYGGSTFGPYVIELTGLNTAEIKEAMSLGYNPRIFIVDYEMTHVADSNYKTFLADNQSFTGNNLKIIEENAKGRTAGVKIIGPQFREFFRVVAFDATDAGGDPVNESATTQTSQVNEISPGVSLEKALKRISYSGVSMEFADYILDFTGIDPQLIIKDSNGEPYSTARIHVRGIRSINGYETRIPLKEVLGEGENKTYVMKPIAEWQVEDFTNFKLWVVFDKGRYYFQAAEYDKNPLLGGTVSGEFNYNGVAVPRTQGITSMIWPGDHYDLVYLNMSEVLGLIKDFGNNPIEAEKTLSFNTRWKMSDLGEKPFDPDSHSQYLGEAVQGDQIELKIKLNGTKYLNPDFGSPEAITDTDIPASAYSAFSYDMSMDGAKEWFSNTEALDFEVSFGSDGNYCDWINLFPGRSPYAFTADYYFYIINNDVRDEFEENLKYSWDYLNQEFIVRFRVPFGLPGVGDSGEVGVYLRTALNSAYRDTIWPLHYSQVKKFRGRTMGTYYDATSNQTAITVEYPTGEKVAGIYLVSGDNLVLDSTGRSYQVLSAVDLGNDRALVTVNGKTNDPDTGLVHKKGDWVYVNLDTPLAEPEVKVAVDNGFFEEWNGECTNPYPAGWDGEREGFHLPLLDPDSGTVFSFAEALGFRTDTMALNWMGNYNVGNPLWNSWADATFLSSLLDIESLITTISDRGIRIFSDIIQTGFVEPGDEFDSLVSTTNSYDQSKPQISISDNRALVVWRSSEGLIYNIRGRIMDMSTGAGVGDDFVVNTTTISNGIQTFPLVSISNNRALVVWGSYADIRGRIIDMTTGAGVGDDFWVGTTSHYTPTDVQISISNSRALVVWEYNAVIRGRIIDMTTGVGVGDDFLVSTSNTDYHDNPQISISNNRALVVWYTDVGGADDNGAAINGRIIDMTTGAGVGDDFQVSTLNSEQQYHPQVSVSNNRAIVVWWYDNGGDYDIRGRIMDMTTGAGVGDDFLVSTSNSGNQQYPQISISDNRALVVWQSYNNGSNYDIRGRIIDMSTGAGVGNDYLVSTSNLNNQLQPQVSIANNHAVVVWQSYENAGYSIIRGRIINMTTGAGEGDDFVISTTNVYNQEGPQLSISNNRVLVVWTSGSEGEYAGEVDNDIRSKIIVIETGPVYGYEAMFSNGLSNFFVSPLIERDYSVTVKFSEEQ